MFFVAKLYYTANTGVAFKFPVVLDDKEILSNTSKIVVFLALKSVFFRTLRIFLSSFLKTRCVCVTSYHSGPTATTIGWSLVISHRLTGVRLWTPKFALEVVLLITAAGVEQHTKFDV